jgi:uncharacterized membrane protein
MDLQTTKYLGGVGALLLFIGPLITYANIFAGLLPLIGFILVLVALKGLADYYNEGGIFNNALYGFIAGIVGGVVSIGILVGTALVTLANLGITDWTDPAAWTDAVMTGAIFSLIGALIITVVVLFIFIVVAAWLYRKSLSMLATKSGVNLFGTAGLIFLIGAFLTIIAIGFLLIWISFILIAIAFFTLRPTPAGPTEPRSSPPP